MIYFGYILLSPPNLPRYALPIYISNYMLSLAFSLSSTEEYNPLPKNHLKLEKLKRLNYTQINILIKCAER